MKNQYFGDIRDLFKYDLIEHVLWECHFDAFYFVPMLTPNDESREGSKTDYSKAKAGFKNTKLLTFLKDKVNNNIREVDQIHSYFQNIGFRYSFKRDTFNQESRKEYFKNVVSEIPENSLIYLDPDIGLETKYPNEKHLLFSEIKFILDNCDNSSVLMIYQHFTRENHLTFLKKKIEKLLKEIHINPSYISDNEIIFFFLTKNEKKYEEVMDSLKKYSKNYSQLFNDYHALLNPQQNISVH